MIRLHHVNVGSQSTEPMVRFYRDLLGLDDISELRNGMAKRGPSGTYFLGEPDLELHLSEIRSFGFLSNGKPMKIAPVESQHGHVAFRTDDITAVKRRLDAPGIPYADYDVWSMNDWYQIYLRDPIGNAVEVQEVMPGGPLGRDAKA